MQGRRTREAGFTLLEALVVLAVVALLAGLAFPAVDRARTAVLARAARSEQTRILLAARANALRFNQPFVLETTARGTGVTMAQDKTGTGAVAAAGPATTQPGGSLLSPAITRIEITPRRIVFYPDGSSTGGTIRLTTADGATTTFMVSRDLGGVSEAVRPRA